MSFVPALFTQPNVFFCISLFLYSVFSLSLRYRSINPAIYTTIPYIRIYQPAGDYMPVVEVIGVAVIVLSAPGSCADIWISYFLTVFVTKKTGFSTHQCINILKLKIKLVFLMYICIPDMRGLNTKPLVITAHVFICIDHHLN